MASFNRETPRLGPCPHGMARPRVADGGTASRYGGQLRIHCRSSRGQPSRGGPPAWGLGEVLTTPRRKSMMLRNAWTIDLAQDRDRWRAVVNVVMNLWFP
jgi:hypothetical protein